MAKAKNIKIISSALLLNPEFPTFGASPDGISDNFVIDEKCPSKPENVKQYVENGKPKPKYYAQIQVQMWKNGLFRVASPNFENDSAVSIYDVCFYKETCNILFNASQLFSNNAIYPVLNK